MNCGLRCKCIILALAFPVLGILGQPDQTEQNQSRSIKNSLDKVIGEVRSRLEAVFASSKRALVTRKRSGSRLIDPPMETILPETWVSGDNNFVFPDMPADIEVDADNPKKGWGEGEPRPRLKKHRKHQKRKKKFNQKRLKKGSKDQIQQNSVLTDETPDPEVYHKYLEEYHSGGTTGNPSKEFASEIEEYSGGHKIVISLPGKSRGNETEASDDISTYLFPELMKENETTFAIVNDLTNQSNKASSIVINEIDVFKNSIEYIEDIATFNDDDELNDLENKLVRLEIAMVDSVSSPRNNERFKVDTEENSTRDAFLPFVTNGDTFSNNIFLEDIASDDIKFDKNEVENKFVKEEGFLEGENSFNTLDSTSTIVAFTIKNEPWVFPILIMASTSIGLVLSFEVLVVFHCVQPDHGQGHPVVGHALLVGLLLCSAISLVYTLTSTQFTCAILRLGSGLSYAMVYSALLVKFVFLAFLRSGIYLPPLYQGFLLFLAILIQVVIGIQWLVAVPPGVTTNHQGVLCGTTFEQQLHGHVYNIFIVAFLVFLNLRFSLVRNKYWEARYIGLVALGSGPLWVSWVLVGLSVPVNYQDLCSASGLLATSVGTFAAMLLAKQVENPSRKVDSKEGTIYRRQDQNTLTTFSICPNIGSGRMFFSLIRLFRPNTRGLTAGSLVSVEHKSQIFFRSNNSSVGTLTRKLEGDSTEGSEADDTSQTYSPEPGYRITNSFDRFPFMSRPLHSTLGHSRPASSLIYSQGEDTMVKQSVSNPNVLFCTPEDMKVLRYDKFR